MNECPACEGTPQFMGFLGRRAHFRCLHCGVDFSSEVDHEDCCDSDDDVVGCGSG